MFVSIEDRNGKISDFQPIENEQSYQRFVSPVLGDSFLCELNTETDFEKGAFQVLVFYERNNATFLTKKIVVSEDARDVEFFNKIRAGSSFSEYSLVSYMAPSLSGKIDGISRTKFSKNKTWSVSEISFFQRSTHYWDVIERTGFSIKPSSVGLASQFRTKADMLEWLMENPQHYFTGDNEKKLWISVWLRLSDISMQNDILETLGIDFAASQSLFDPNLLRVLRRLRCDWRSYSAEGALDNLIELLLTEELSEDYTSIDLNIASDIHAFMTKNVFGFKPKEELGGDTIKDLMNWLEEHSDPPKYMTEIRGRDARQQGNRSLSCDWIVASAVFGARLGQVNPSIVPEIAHISVAALEEGAEDMGYDEFRLASYVLSKELLPLLELIDKKRNSYKVDKKH